MKDHKDDLYNHSFILHSILNIQDYSRISVPIQVDHWKVWFENKDKPKFDLTCFINKFNKLLLILLNNQFNLLFK